MEKETNWGMVKGRRRERDSYTERDRHRQRDRHRRRERQSEGVREWGRRTETHIERNWETGDRERHAHRQTERPTDVHTCRSFLNRLVAVIAVELLLSGDNSIPTEVVTAVGIPSSQRPGCYWTATEGRVYRLTWDLFLLLFPNDVFPHKSPFRTRPPCPPPCPSVLCTPPCHCAPCLRPGDRQDQFLSMAETRDLLLMAGGCLLQLGPLTRNYIVTTVGCQQSTTYKSCDLDLMTKRCLGHFRSCNLLLMAGWCLCNLECIEQFYDSV